MTIGGLELISQYWAPNAFGPVAQVDLTSVAALGTLPTTGTIAASGNWLSKVIQSGGFKAIAVGAKSTQVGAINIQRYLDAAGLIPIGAVITVALAATVANFVSVADDVPFQSYTVQITNTSGSAATVTNFAVLMSSK